MLITIHGNLDGYRTVLFWCRHDGGDYRQAAGEGHRPHTGEEEEGQDCPRGQYLPTFPLILVRIKF
jgi:hypothetical protein